MFWKRNCPTAFIKVIYLKIFDSILGEQLLAFEGTLCHKRESQCILVHWVNCCHPKTLRETCLLFCLQLACLSQMIHRVTEQHLVAFILSFATCIWYLAHSMYLQCQILFIKLTKTGCDVLPARTKCDGVKSWKGKLCFCTEIVHTQQQQDLLSSWSAFSAGQDLGRTTTVPHLSELQWLRNGYFTYCFGYF